MIGEIAALAVALGQGFAVKAAIEPARFDADRFREFASVIVRLPARTSSQRA